MTAPTTVTAEHPAPDGNGKLGDDIQSIKERVALARSMAIEGPVIQWVADHRKHHKFSDRDGDPHSPWRYGNSVPALIKGLVYAHIGWLFDPEQTPPRRYAPDLLKDRDIVRISRQ